MQENPTNPDPAEAKEVAETPVVTETEAPVATERVTETVTETPVVPTESSPSENNE